MLAFVAAIITLSSGSCSSVRSSYGARGEQGRRYTHRKNGEGLGGRSKKRRQDRASSVGEDRGYLENINNKEAKREAQGAES